MPPLCHRGDADPGCHPVPPSATCHPWITEGVQTPGATPVPSPCCERHVPSPCHQGGHSSTHFPTHSPAVPPRTCRLRVPPPCHPCALLDILQHPFPPLQPSRAALSSALLPSAMQCSISPQHEAHTTLSSSGEENYYKTKEQLYFSRTFNNLPQPAARQQFPIRRARRMERSGFVGTEGGICRALHEGKNNIAVRCWCCN